jgi:integrase
MRLTVKRVAKLRKVPGRHHDGKGLYLEVTPALVASWTYRYMRRGDEHWMGLGSLDVVTLPEARELHQEARKLLKKSGLDPIEYRRSERAKKAAEEAAAQVANVTFKECAEQYYRLHSPKWSTVRHARQYLSSMAAYVFPVIGALPVSAINKALVLKVIEPVWFKVPTTANRVRGRIKEILDLAKVRGYRDGDNPAEWANCLEHVLPARGTITKVSPHAALDWRDVPAFMDGLASNHEGIAARCLQFTVLTACRTGEVVGAKWDELDFAAKTWTIPAERMKARKEHRVPLSEPALQILRSLPREKGSPFAFISAARKGKSLSSTAMNGLLRHMQRSGDISVHGFRSSFRDWCSEATSFPDHIAEMCLAHTIGNAVERAYKRTDLFEKRRQLMAAWAKFATSKPVAKTTPSGNVVPIGRA